LWDRPRLAREVHRGLARPSGAPAFGDVAAPPFDRAQAIRALDEAGYRDSNGDGVREFQGTAIRFSILQPAGARGVATETRAFAHDLRRAGLLLDIVTVDPATLLARVGQGNFDLAPLVWEGLRDDDPRLLWGPKGLFDQAGYRSPEVTRLLDEIRTAADPAARAPLMQRLARTVADDQAALFLYQHDTAALVSERVRGLAAVGDRLDFRGVWLNP
jgi:peptide/nickel transport system substrate-binding protein